MGLSEIREVLEKHKAELANKYHVSQIGVFGSYVRNEQTSQSDVDIMLGNHQYLLADVMFLRDMNHVKFRSRSPIRFAQCVAIHIGSSGVLGVSSGHEKITGRIVLAIVAHLPPQMHHG